MSLTSRSGFQFLTAIMASAADSQQFTSPPHRVRMALTKSRESTSSSTTRIRRPSSAAEKLAGIVKEVPEDLLQTIWIAWDRTTLLVHHSFKLNVFCLKRWPNDIDSSFDHCTDINWPRLYLEFPGDYPGHVEQIVDQLRLGARVALDSFKRARHLGFVELSGTDQMTAAQDGRK